MIHPAETMAGGFCQGQNDMIVTTREQARKKKFSLFLEIMKVYEEVYGDDVPSGTRVMSGRWVETMKPPSVESQVDSARLRRTSQ